MATHGLFILSWHDNFYGSGTVMPISKPAALKLVGLLGIDDWTLETFYTDDPDAEPTGEVYEGMDSDIENWGV